MHNFPLLNPAGVVLDVALVSLIAPRAVIGSRPMVPANQSGFQKWLGTIPSAALEASQKGEVQVLLLLLLLLLLLSWWCRP
jgi:hypothetical protein